MALGNYDVTFNGVAASTLGLYAMERPSMPAPEWRVQKVTVPGRDGDLYIQDGGLQDIQISVRFNFIGAPSSWGNTFRALKLWTDSPDTSVYLKMRQLVFSDDSSYAYAVKRVTVGTTERVARSIGQARVTFVCDGWSYLTSGLAVTTVADGTQSITMTNPTTYVAKPIFVFRSPTVGATFTITDTNGNAKTFEVGTSGSQTIVINCRLGSVTNASGVSRLSLTNGDLAAFDLQPGTNTLTIDTNTLTTMRWFGQWRTL